ncbi:MAG: DUF4105 domain-containing protein [Dysgonamonadaceae bacterium]|jgi:hypothetical protein|nr:DUF4105 domain-containing protein [Dysgonamonadaceae bacterium]
MRHYLFYILVLLISLPVKAFETKNLQVSLLTVMPRSNEVYTIYGHTALRIYDPEQQIDAVFNWGTFDFNAPYFLYRFIKGETDYFLSVTDYEHFLYAYSHGDATVVEQILNITPEGKEKLFQILSLNLRPENVMYRYNFLFDNCTTRIRDIIENCTGQSLTYPEQTKETTFRKLIHSCTKPYPWMTFGIDLLIGSGADSVIHFRQELFLPLHLKKALDRSFLPHSTPVVISEKQVLTNASKDTSKLNFGDSPLVIGCIIFLVYLIISWAGWTKKRRLNVVFAPLFFAAGAAGCLIGFVTLFSDHPCTSPNWNLLWLHPFHWIAFSECFFKKTYPFLFGYHTINLGLLFIVLIAWHWLPQVLNTANIPYILCLGLASGYKLLLFGRYHTKFGCNNR